MDLSAKDLCSRSCMQIKMFHEHPELKPKPTFNMLEGERHHKEVVDKLKDVIGMEMGGCFSFNTGEVFRVWFSNDVLCEKGIIEIKSVNKDRDCSWYFNNSCTQCAVYSSLSHICKYDLRTAKFFVNQGNPYQRHVYQQMIVPYFLYFGDEVYRIDVTDATAILDFISEKASSCADWDLAREFDRKYKHMEYKILSQYFKVTRVK